MAAASATLSSGILNVASVNTTSPRRNRSRVHCIAGLNYSLGLKPRSFVNSTGFVHSNQAFAKMASLIHSPSKGKGRAGGALSASMSAAGEIFRIAAIINGLVLVGVALGFVLLRIEASIEEAD